MNVRRKRIVQDLDTALSSVLIALDRTMFVAEFDAVDEARHALDKAIDLIRELP